MKKIITLCLFAFALFAGTLTVDAQEKFKIIEERIKVESQELQKVLNLDDSQTAMVWRTMLAKERSYFDKIQGKDPKDPEVMDTKNRIDANFKSKMLQILTDEHFKTLTTWLSKQKKY